MLLSEDEPAKHAPDRFTPGTCCPCGVADTTCDIIFVGNLECATTRNFEFYLNDTLIGAYDGTQPEQLLFLRTNSDFDAAAMAEPELSACPTTSYDHQTFPIGTFATGTNTFRSLSTNEGFEVDLALYCVRLQFLNGVWVGTLVFFISRIFFPNPAGTIDTEFVFDGWLPLP